MGYIKNRKRKAFVFVLAACILPAHLFAYADVVTVTPLTGSGTVVSGPSQEAVSPDASGESAAAPAASAAVPSAGPGAASIPSETSAPGAAAGPTSVSGTSSALTAEALLAAASGLDEPTVSAEGAILLEASTGTVLYGKNAETTYYPASITKLMTALLVAENCSMDETVTFSSSAVTDLESGAVTIYMTAGETMGLKDCMYALLLKSANDVGNALAEHVAGSVSAFADMMNERAVELGCTGTHFTNPHGLNDENHYTTARDMALIARAAFENDTVRTIAGTLTYTLPATLSNPSGLTLTMGHKMINPSDSRYDEYVLGGKTGYTSKAGNTLVTVAEKDGVRFVAVILKSSSTHYTDTRALLDYAYEIGANVSEAGLVSASLEEGAPSGEVIFSAGPGAVQ